MTRLIIYGDGFGTNVLVGSKTLMSFPTLATNKFAPALAFIMATGLVAGCSLPAFATNAEPEFAALSKDDTGIQTVVVSTTAESPQAVRDGFTVTDPTPVVEIASTSNRYVAGVAPASIYSGSAVLAYASSFIDVVPYGNGNTPDDSFSCDGFVQYVLSGFGISVPRGANSIAANGVAISPSDAVAGDLLWWPGQHIAFYDGAGGMYDSPDWGKYVQHRGSIWGDPVYIRLV